jgi:uncharacterized protein (DUF1330 family)
MPKAYLIAEHIITEPAVFEEYRVKVGTNDRKIRGTVSDKGQCASVPGGRSLGARARRHH